MRSTGYARTISPRSRHSGARLPFRLATHATSNSLQFWALAIFLVLAFALGGGARGDIQSLVIFRPLSLLLCGFALWTLTWDDVRRHALLFGIAGLLVVLVGAHLIPLPPSIWTRLPGRELIAQLDQASGLNSVWRPLSLVPTATANAFYSLFAPLAVLLLGVQLKRDEHLKLLPILIALGVLSAVLGILQLAGSGESLLYFYSVTNEGAPVGLFANRNHAAAYLACLPPMLAVYAATASDSHHRDRFRLWLLCVVTLVVLPLILISGSRGGMLVAVAGLVAVPLLYRRSTTSRGGGAKKFNPVYLVAGAGIALLALLFVVFSRAESLNRLLAYDGGEDLRFRMWGPIADLAWKYFPAGSGIGSFEEVYKLDEPLRLLKPTYVNHAHNDWLEMYLTGGVAGILILALIAFFWARATLKAWTATSSGSRGPMLARLGSTLLLMLALASVADYPLRTPSMMCFAALCAIWLQAAAIRPTSASRLEPENNGSEGRSRLARPREI